MADRGNRRLALVLVLDDVPLEAAGGLGGRHDRRPVELHRLASEQIVELHRTQVGQRDTAAQQVVHGGHGERLDAGLTAELKRALARFVGVPPEEITVVRNTTEALNVVLQGVPLERGEEVLYCSREYPSMQDALEQRALAEHAVGGHIAEQRQQVVEPHAGGEAPERNPVAAMDRKDEREGADQVRGEYDVLLAITRGASTARFVAMNYQKAPYAVFSLDPGANGAFRAGAVESAKVTETAGRARHARSRTAPSTERPDEAAANAVSSHKRPRMP